MSQISRLVLAQTACFNVGDALNRTVLPAFTLTFSRSAPAASRLAVLALHGLQGELLVSFARPEDKPVDKS